MLGSSETVVNACVYIIACMHNYTNTTPQFDTLHYTTQHYTAHSLDTFADDSINAAALYGKNKDRLTQLEQLNRKLANAGVLECLY
jgi:hypothetical protein